MAQADNPTDIVIILGCRTNEDGSPTEMMKSRVKRAAELYTSLKQQNIDCRVIATGYQAPDQVIDSCPNVPMTFGIILLYKESHKKKTKKQKKKRASVFYVLFRFILDLKVILAKVNAHQLTYLLKIFPCPKEKCAGTLTKTY